MKDVKMKLLFYVGSQYIYIDIWAKDNNCPIPATAVMLI